MVAPLGFLAQPRLARWLVGAAIVLMGVLLLQSLGFLSFSWLRPLDPDAQVESFLPNVMGLLPDQEVWLEKGAERTLCGRVSALLPEETGVRVTITLYRGRLLAQNCVFEVSARSSGKGAEAVFRGGSGNPLALPATVPGVILPLEADGLLEPPPRWPEGIP